MRPVAAVVVADTGVELALERMVAHPVAAEEEDMGPVLVEPVDMADNPVDSPVMVAVSREDTAAVR